MLRKLSFDANVVQFYGACLQEENTMMVLEYMAVSYFHSFLMLSVSNIAKSACLPLVRPSSQLSFLHGHLWLLLIIPFTVSTQPDCSSVSN